MTVGHVTWVIVLDGPSINVLEPLGVNNVNVGDNKVKQVLIILVSNSIRSCLQITYDFMTLTPNFFSVRNQQMV